MRAYSARSRYIALLWRAKSGEMSRSTASMASPVSAPASTKKTLATRSRSRPLFSSATTVLSKLGGSGLAEIASSSARWAAKARSKAGRKWSGLIAGSGGRPKAPVQSVSSGLSGIGLQAGHADHLAIGDRLG